MRFTVKYNPTKYKPWGIYGDDGREFCRYFAESTARSMTNILNTLPENKSKVRNMAPCKVLETMNNTD
jgi:hypothetical protein